MSGGCRIADFTTPFFELLRLSLYQWAWSPQVMGRFALGLNPGHHNMVLYLRSIRHLSLHADLLGNVRLMAAPIRKVEHQQETETDTSRQVAGCLTSISLSKCGVVGHVVVLLHLDDRLHTTILDSDVGAAATGVAGFGSERWRVRRREELQEIQLKVVFDRQIGAAPKYVCRTAVNYETPDSSISIS